ncbi:MAG: DNA topoisomerase I [Nitrososphaeria archaeon]|nr:DNA topoisomerase I [Nitrososphaeria archaeon]NIN53523.1 DNA topoisomerase I [Nitrososphaeria archaeon]NIQ34036.1 DNA topoisomerase I [Nitrososphaeria archaeon]
MEQLHHNGVLFSPRFEGRGFTVQVRGETIKLTPDQEEMAVAWAKKKGTSYVDDPMFAENFHHDFSKKLGVDIKPGDIDYSEIFFFVEEERTWKANLSREERRQMAARRKAQRETNKASYGYVWVDGVQMEVANYTVEPSSIFIGRGSHPLRGRWKEGSREEDVELNLSPDAPRPQGKWKAIIWQPDAMWIARWRDKLTGKMKYVWISDSSILKQKKDIEKFDRARELRLNLEKIQRHIWDNLEADDLRRRKTATVCFLIDKLKIRVGDEKDPDEADTVGASTLRPEHIRFNSDGSVTLDFLGKDSVPHIFVVKHKNVVRNLKEFAANARFTLFDGVDSKKVSEFLDEAMTGLSAKVFRTCYASDAVETKLEKVPVKLEDPEYVKRYVAMITNLEAAKVCNHRRTIPKTWKSSLEKKKVRLNTLKDRAKESQDKLKLKADERREKYQDRLRNLEGKLKSMEEKQESYQCQLADRKRQGKPVEILKRRINLRRVAVARQKQRLKNLEVKHSEQMKKLKERQDSRRQRDKAAIEKLKLQIKARIETRNYNLGTSLKSYIDPRIYYKWGKQVDYDWKKYYSKTLQRKFSWVETHNKSLKNKKLC